MIFVFICINFERTSKNDKKCQKELGTFLPSRKFHDVSKMPDLRFLAPKMPSWQPLAKLCAQNVARQKNFWQSFDSLINKLATKIRELFKKLKK